MYQLALRNIDARNAGRYRTQNVMISGAEHRPPDYLSVPQEMEAFGSCSAIDCQHLHPVEHAARLHADFGVK
ncbi:Fic family protein [Chlorobaculum limnaeum]|uniref:Fic family protein n=1 Tax=Chlorobaculum limnaeum TaxID=274537 RepID=UPI001969B63E